MVRLSARPSPSCGGRDGFEVRMRRVPRTRAQARARRGRSHPSPYVEGAIFGLWTGFFVGLAAGMALARWLAG